jgi:hypothetical protein
MLKTADASMDQRFPNERVGLWLDKEGNFVKPGSNFEESYSRSHRSSHPGFDGEMITWWLVTTSLHLGHVLPA